MRKFLQLTLVLSCLLILSSDNINVAGHIDVWTTGHTLEENLNDTDNHDFDGMSSKIVLITAALSLKDKKLFFERNSKKTQLTYGFIRAPPNYTL